MKFRLFLLFLLLLPSVLYADNPEFRESTEDYLEFTERKAGVITVEQLDMAGVDNVVLINVNSERQFNNGYTIPGSHNMDWREVLKRRDEIPEDQTVVIYCNTMLYSSRAQLLLNMDGFDNVLLLQGGLNRWNKYVAGY